MAPTLWQHRAACATTDPELFFPVGVSGPAIQQAAVAATVCAPCPVRAECLAFALEHGLDAGVWGGLSEFERRQLKTTAGNLVTTGGTR